MRRNRSQAELAALGRSASAVRLSELEGGARPPPPPPEPCLGASSSVSTRLLSARPSSPESAPLIDPAHGAPLIDGRGEPGDVDLSPDIGRTRYHLAGPPPARSEGLVVCVHGLTLASYIWSDLAARLASEQRLAVLTFDLAGRGGSSLAAEATLNGRGCDEAFFARQLAELLRALGLWTEAESRGGCALIGSSLGGGVVAAFAQRHPEMVARVALVAPVGVMPPPFFARLHRMGCLGRCAQAVLEHGCPCLARAHVRMQFEGCRWEDAVEEDMERGGAGWVRGFWSTLKRFSFDGLHDAFRAAGRARGGGERPVLVLWGERDHVVPPEGARELRRLVPHADVEVLRNHGHEVTIALAGRQGNERVNRRLAGFCAAGAAAWRAAGRGSSDREASKAQTQGAGETRGAGARPAEGGARGSGVGSLVKVGSAQGRPPSSRGTRPRPRSPLRPTTPPETGGRADRAGSGLSLTYSEPGSGSDAASDNAASLERAQFDETVFERAADGTLSPPGAAVFPPRSDGDPRAPSPADEPLFV
jgi:pimeloyl-ACP methyl ester carboxylesterase